jgi:glycosyltransferase involved in cell wall biosynthesis
LDNLTNRPHIVVLGGVWPHIGANREAANVVSHQLLHQLAESNRFRITFQFLNWTAADIPERAQQELDELATQGVSFAQPIILGHSQKTMTQRLASSGWRLALGDFAALTTGAKHRPFVAAALNRLAPDLLLTIWSELAQNLVGPLPNRKIAYAGNPDYKVFTANRNLRALEGPPTLAAHAKDRLIEMVVRRSHIAVMRGFDQVLNIALNDADDYRDLGITADYIQNTWPTAVHPDWRTLRDRDEQEHPLRIVGNVGNLSATGNSFGLLTIAKDILPRLKSRLGENKFEIHLFGASTPKPAIAKLLNDPHIRVRGFVDDLDTEIMRAPIFLVANNHHAFKVTHTRYLHAWSLGACCIGFEDSRQSMPEIEHNNNALLASDLDGIVAEIARAADDRVLRRRLGDGGIATLKRHFSPARVAERLIQQIDKVLAPIS